MSSWTDALYDTCCLVTLGRLLLDHEGTDPAFCSVWGIEESLSPTWMRPRTAARLRATIRLCDLPPLPKLKRILSDAALPAAVAEVDRLTFAAAVHHRHRVVTSDKALAAALKKAKLQVLDSGMALDRLVPIRALAAGMVGLYQGR